MDEITPDRPTEGDEYTDEDFAVQPSDPDGEDGNATENGGT